MISLSSVEKTYSSSAARFSALRGIDLQVRRGELLAIVGRSGSGKSTLLNMIGGIDRATSGSVIVNSTDLGALDEARLAAWRGATIGFVFQFFQLLPTLTTLENVMLPMDFAGSVPVRERRSRAMSLLDQVGVGAHSAKLPAALSGGEQQRVSIARALANDPPVVLADEPTGNLDSTTAAQVVALLRSLATDGKTVVVVTHDTNIGHLADRTVALADGRVIGDTAANGDTGLTS